MVSRRPEPICNTIGRERVDTAVRVFYERLRAHPQLKQFFAHIPDFSAHERHIADFWWLAMGGRLEQHPQFDMMRRHRPLQLNDAAFATPSSDPMPIVPTRRD